MEKIHWSFMLNHKIIPPPKSLLINHSASVNYSTLDLRCLLYLLFDAALYFAEMLMASDITTFFNQLAFSVWSHDSKHMLSKE